MRSVRFRSSWLSDTVGRNPGSGGVDDVELFLGGEDEDRED